VNKFDRLVLVNGQQPLGLADENTHCLPIQPSIAKPETRDIVDVVASGSGGAGGNFILNTNAVPFGTTASFASSRLSACS
jgi:hypothetical protein